MKLLILSVAVGILSLAACAPNAPYRDLAARPNVPSKPSNKTCDDTYSSEAKSSTAVDHVRAALASRDTADCWTATWERRPEFDLFTVEFDDQGWLAGAAKNPDIAANQFSMLSDRLDDLVLRENAPLSMVMYTHGWHHSADPTDSNMSAFRSLLRDMVTVEKELCLAKRQGVPTEKACTLGEEGVTNRAKVRRVVGIYVGWRGDSVLGPGLEHASIWDRKSTAEKVALGSVQELYSGVHDFWRRHACHLRRKEEAGPDCVDVRLLTIGHSFGGLITYRGLAPRLMTGIIETYHDRPERKKELSYAYGFGDFAVLINPAFEGSRFEALARAASRRTYEAGESKDPQGPTAQMPFFVIAQSIGDVPTGTFFPMFRRATTLFERVEEDQKTANLQTVGWNRRYITHELKLEEDKRHCSSQANSPIREKLSAEAVWAEGHLKNKFRGLNASEMHFCYGLVLRKVKDEESKNPLNRPDFLPIWVVQTEKNVIANHNDFLNPRFVDFIRPLYFMVERGTDHYLRVRH